MTVARAGLGVMVGFALWWLVFYPLTWVGLFPQPWEMKDGSLVINDLFGSIGKAVGVVALPLVMAYVFAAEGGRGA